MASGTVLSSVRSGSGPRSGSFESNFVFPAERVEVRRRSLEQRHTRRGHVNAMASASVRLFAHPYELLERQRDRLIPAVRVGQHLEYELGSRDIHELAA